MARTESAKAATRTVAIYTRVSTDHQTTENQERELREIASRMSSAMGPRSQS